MINYPSRKKIFLKIYIYVRARRAGLSLKPHLSWLFFRDPDMLGHKPAPLSSFLGFFLTILLFYIKVQNKFNKKNYYTDKVHNLNHGFNRFSHNAWAIFFFKCISLQSNPFIINDIYFYLT